MPRRESRSRLGKNKHHRLEAQLLHAAQRNDANEVKRILEAARSNGPLNGALLSIGLARSAGWGCIDSAQYLLREGADINIDGNRVPSFLRAVERNHVGVVQLLLDYGASTETRNNKGWTAVMIAAWKKNWHVVQLLISRGADVNARDYRKRNVLHILADKYCDLDKLHLLMRAGCDIEARDELGRTPLHWTCATGNIYFAEQLLNLCQGPTAFIDTIESRGKTALHIATEHARSDVVELLLKYGANANARSDGGWSPLHSACANGYKRTVSILLESGAGINSQCLDGTTPLHLAAKAGHLEVILCLYNRPDLERMMRDSFGDTPFLRAAQYGRKDILQLLAQPNNADVLSADAIAACERFEATIIDFGNKNRVRKVTVYDLLYARDHLNPRRPAITTLKDSKTDFRWIHLPANNMAWIEALLTKNFIEEGARDVEGFKNLEDTFNQQHKGQYSYSRFMNPFCQCIGPTVRDRAIICLFMPYLHFETTVGQQKMQGAIRRGETAASFPGEPPKTQIRDELLIRAYHPSSSGALHVRRTLDQFLYPNIDTQSRDQDQVVFRYQIREGAVSEPKIYMVDQLWLWVLGNDLVITSFPQRWEQPKNDPLDVLDGIIGHINRTRDPVCSVYDLAIIISGHCSGLFDRHRKGDEEYQFLDMFDSSVGIAAHREETLYRNLSSASAQASEWLKRHRQSNHLSHLKSTIRSASRNFRGRIYADTEALDVIDEQDQNPVFVDNFLDIGPETDLFAEVKDIRDELHMIGAVLGHQQDLLADLQNAIYEAHQVESRSIQKNNKRFRELRRTVDMHIKDVHRIDRHAERIYMSISHLLDLKQKNANPFEARLARDQAAGAIRQGKAVMMFTIVTIVFLPMSFITSFFALNVVEFPHADGSTYLPLSYVSKYIFGIGISVSIPLILLAFSLDDIKHGCYTVYRRLCRWNGSVTDLNPTLDVLEIENIIKNRSLESGFSGDLLPVANRRPVAEPPRI